MFYLVAMLVQYYCIFLTYGYVSVGSIVTEQFQNDLANSKTNYSLSVAFSNCLSSNGETASIRVQVPGGNLSIPLLIRCKEVEVHFDAEIISLIPESIRLQSVSTCQSDFINEALNAIDNSEVPDPLLSDVDKLLVNLVDQEESIIRNESEVRR